MIRPQFGYLLPTRDRIVLDDHDPVPLIHQARLAEALGFDSVWAGDGLTARPRADPLVMLAAAAAVTDRVTLGTAVLLAALRHPVLLAHQLATLDRLAGGRLVVGLGAGFPHAVTAAQFEVVGVGFAQRVGRLEESIEAMRMLWATDEASFHGRHVQFVDVSLAPRPVRPGGPPLWLAGGGMPALRRVARLADGWLPYPPTAQAYAQDLSAMGTSTRRVTPALYATVCLDSDPERARRRLRASIERYYNAPLELVEAVQAMFAGPARDAAAWLDGYVTAGARHVVVRLAVDDHVEAMAEFAEQVLPLVRGGVRS